LAIYRGAGGSGDATQDAASEVLLALQAKDAAIAAEVAAEAAQAAAQTSATNAATSATNASNSASTASTQATNAASSASAASTSASAASTSATNAAASASTATTQATNAASSASSASTSASNASTSASAASTSATNAANSATSASGSASTATTQATNASNSATAAATSATNAANSATAASTSETNAASSATSASGSASTATTQATNAASSATSASGSASTATTQAGIATTQATNAASSASSASTSATNAASSASTATTQATNASNSASSASTSATNAANSATAAAASAASINPASIAITGGSINGTTIGATTASTGKFSTLEATGVTTVQAGTVSLPAITTTGDTNTGIFFPAADTIAFTEGGVESMRIDSAGRVGIGQSSPTAKLEVIGEIYASQATANTQQIRLTPQASGVNIIYSTYAGTNSYLPLAFNVGGAERLRIDTSGQVAIGITTATAKLTVDLDGTANKYSNLINGAGTIGMQTYGTFGTAHLRMTYPAVADWDFLAGSSGQLAFIYNSSERMRINSAGDLLIGKTAADDSTPGFRYSVTNSSYYLSLARNGEPLYINRITTDGTLVGFAQDSTTEGNISVSGTTVSYNGGHLSRWSQLPDGSKDESIVKGTVMSNLDDMCVWEKDGVVADNEQLNKMKVSDVEGDTNVAGVFVNWTMDDAYGVDDMNVAMTGDMIIRIADGVVVQKGDLLMSAGDGTAKPQGDDIVRSKTVAKVTSNHVTCTYADGSYCVPCVLMAC